MSSNSDDDSTRQTPSRQSSGRGSARPRNAAGNQQTPLNPAGSVGPSGSVASPAAQEVISSPRPRASGGRGRSRSAGRGMSSASTSSSIPRPQGGGSSSTGIGGSSGGHGRGGVAVTSVPTGGGPGVGIVRRKRAREEGDAGAGPSSRPAPIVSQPEAAAAQQQNPQLICLLCGARFDTDKSLCGHMRMHPEREWRGIYPPPSFSREEFADVRDLLNPEPGEGDNAGSGGSVAAGGSGEQAKTEEPTAQSAMVGAGGQHDAAGTSEVREGEAATGPKPLDLNRTPSPEE